MGRVEPTSSFAGEAQPVEVFHRGAWYAGELLGWRFADDGRCLARVRCVVDGLRHSTWKDLLDLRLPRPAEAERVPPARPPAARIRRPVSAVHGGRHRALDDDTQPHLLLLDRGPRPSPAGLPLPAPRRPAAAAHPRADQHPATARTTGGVGSGQPPQA